MQTFLPYASFTESAQVLDRQRLGKQRVETWQILNALDGKTKGWVSHPVTKMWRGYEYALCEYGIEICLEWIARGYQDCMLERFVTRISEVEDWDYPAWLGIEDLHLSHRSNLVRKFPEHYGTYFPDVPDNLPYLWV